MLTDFQEPDVENRWKIANDDVMGGQSKGGPSFEDGKLVFSGETITKPIGGFSSIRTREAEVLDLSFADSIHLRVKGDGRPYKFEMRTSVSISKTNAIPYRANFNTKANEWIEVVIPVDKFKATLHGFDMSGIAPALDLGDIRSFGLMIYDKEAGEFQLEVDWIKAVSTKGITTSDEKPVQF